MSFSNGDLLQKLEVATQNLETGKISKFVTELLRHNKHSSESRLQASEFFRRVSDYSRALTILACDTEPGRISQLSEIEIQVYLQHARLKNLLGASTQALRIIHALSNTQKNQFCSIVAPLLVSNYEFEEARKILEPIADRIESKELTYDLRRRLLTLVDVYSGLKLVDPALKLLDKIRLKSTEPLFLAILHEVRAALYLDQNELKDASREFEKSLELFPKNTSTVDIGYLVKNMGRLAVLKKDTAEAKKLLNQAMTILYKQGFKPEIWLEVLFWKGRLALLQKPDVFPNEFKTLLIYPKPMDRFTKEVQKLTSISETLVISHSHHTKRRIDLTSDIAYDLPLGNFDVGLSVPQIVLGHCIAAHPYGIPQHRLYDLLWGDTWDTENHMKKRFEQSVMRIRKDLKIDIQWIHGHLMLKSGSHLPQVSSSTQAPVKAEIFFENHGNQSFGRTDLEAFFCIKRAPADSLIKHWLGLGQIKELSRGKFELSKF